MAENLVRKGYPVVVYDIDEDCSRGFSKKIKCQWTSDFAVLGKSADIVITMLPDGDVVRDVLLDTKGGGLAPHLEKDSLIIDMSSSDPVGTIELGKILAALSLHLVDAPVSGGRAKAEEGKLSIMIGGDDEISVNRAIPVIETLGQRCFRTGSLGSGHATKSLNNYLASVNFAAAAEAIIVGKRFGLESDTLLDVINASTGRNFCTEHTLKSEVLGNTFNAGFSLGLLLKDIKIANSLSGQLNLKTPFISLSEKAWSEACEEAGEAADFTRAFISWQKQKNL